MSTACGRPQGGGGVQPIWTHVDKRRGSKPDFFGGRHKCIAPNQTFMSSTQLTYFRTFIQAYIHTYMLIYIHSLHTYIHTYIHSYIYTCI